MFTRPCWAWRCSLKPSRLARRQTQDGRTIATHQQPHATLPAAASATAAARVRQRRHASQAVSLELPSGTRSVSQSVDSRVDSSSGARQSLPLLYLTRNLFTDLRSRKLEYDIVLLLSTYQYREETEYVNLCPARLLRLSHPRRPRPLFASDCDSATNYDNPADIPPHTASYIIAKPHRLLRILQHSLEYHDILRDTTNTTKPDRDDTTMSGGLSVEQHIDAVDAFARTLFLRARDYSPSVANAVQQLHIALRHLRVEAADPDSPLSGGSYTQQVAPIVDDCGAALRQLEDALEDGRRGDQIAGRVRGLRERIDGFLDAVQLQSRATIPPAAQDPSSLEGIKDKVDKVAQRVFSRRDSGFPEDEDSLWREFKTELEEEGFSPEVLKKHKVRCDRSLCDVIYLMLTMSRKFFGHTYVDSRLCRQRLVSPNQLYEACLNMKLRCRRPRRCTLLSTTRSSHRV